MATTEKETPRFESFPPEIRNMVYENLLSAKLCKEIKLHRFVPRWIPQHQYTYIFHTAILRSNRLIGQEAKFMLYRSNTLVLINWNIDDRDGWGLILNKIPGNVAFNHIPNGTQLPPYIVQINHQDIWSGRTRVSMIVAAADVRSICERLVGRCDRFGCPLRASYSLVALPQPGWPYERLLETIWLPLKAIRNHRCPDTAWYGYIKFKVIDKTGVFEKTDESSDWDQKSEQESNTATDRDSDTEGNESDERDSNDDGVEDDEIEEIGRASTSSEESDSGKDDGDEHGKAEDESDEGASSKDCSNDPGEKTSHNAASNSGHAGDANAAVVVKENNVAGGRSEDKLGSKMPGADESHGDVDRILDKGDIEERDS